MRARDVMTAQAITVRPDASVAEVARLLVEYRISAVPVVDAANHVLGIVSEGDLLHRAETGTERTRSWWLRLITSAEQLATEYVKAHARTAAEVMTRKVIAVHEDMELGAIAELLERNGIKRVPVVRAGVLVGIVSRADLIRALASAATAAKPPSETDDEALRQAILDRMSKEPWTSSSINVNVIVTDRAAHLWGFASSAEERRALAVLAETTSGVSRVVDHLRIAPASMGMGI